MIASPQPGCLVGGAQQRIDLHAIKEMNNLLVVPFAGNRQDALDVCAVIGLFKGCESEK